MFETNIESEIGIVVGVNNTDAIDESMDELANLCQVAGIEVEASMVQSLPKPNNATYIGSGKVEELRDYCHNHEIEVVVFNDELSGIQLRNLEEKLDVKVLDRTILILDIFASRAVSKEGKLQVELAQLQYRIPRLVGFGKSLSRLAGGIGTRGPGEKKLESDRRHIQRRMDNIKKELKKVKVHRENQRSSRKKRETPVVALVGYTNSGKSAIMNYMLSKTMGKGNDVLEKNILFATLDAFQRKIKVEGGREFILVDTVGFVSKLPHSLIDAFKSTLEEVRDADILLQIMDISRKNNDFQTEVVDGVLEELGASDKEKIMVYNKIDLLDLDKSEKKALIKNSPVFGDGREVMYVSAKQGSGMEKLLNRICEKLFTSPSESSRSSWSVNNKGQEFNSNSESNK